jgi:hypothetical protein
MFGDPQIAAPAKNRSRPRRTSLEPARPPPQPMHRPSAPTPSDSPHPRMNPRDHHATASPAGRISLERSPSIFARVRLNPRDHHPPIHRPRRRPAASSHLPSARSRAVWRVGPGCLAGRVGGVCWVCWPSLVSLLGLLVGSVGSGGSGAAPRARAPSRRPKDFFHRSRHVGECRTPPGPPTFRKFPRCTSAFRVRSSRWR